METVSPWKSHPQARKTQRLLAYILFTLQTENSISLDTLFVDSIGILQVLLSISIYKLFELYLIIKVKSPGLKMSKTISVQGLPYRHKDECVIVA